MPVITCRNYKPQFGEMPWVRVELTERLDAESSAEAKVLRRNTAGDTIDTGIRIDVCLNEGSQSFFSGDRGLARYWPDRNAWEFVLCSCIPCCVDICRDGCVADGGGYTTDQELRLAFVLSGVGDQAGLTCSGGSISACSGFNGVSFGNSSVECGFFSDFADECFQNYVTSKGFTPDMLDSNTLAQGQLFTASTLACNNTGGFSYSAQPAIFRCTDGRWAMYAKVTDIFSRERVGVALLGSSKPTCAEIDVDVTLEQNSATYTDFSGTHNCYTEPGTPPVPPCTMPTSINITGFWVPFP